MTCVGKYHPCCRVMLSIKRSEGLAERAGITYPRIDCDSTEPQVIQNIERLEPIEMGFSPMSQDSKEGELEPIPFPF